MMTYPTIAEYIGSTPLVRLAHINQSRTTVLAKLEGNNPAGSVKDRPAFYMIKKAKERGDLADGAPLVEATSGNTGIALAMAASVLGHPITLIMPKNATQERKDTMRAFGATLIELDGTMEDARDMAAQLAQKGAYMLDQFNNPDCAAAHYHSTARELWTQTDGKITHFVSAMGTTGTVMGVSRYLKEQNPNIQIIGLEPADGSNIAGIRKWPQSHLPKIFDPTRLDARLEIQETDAKNTMLALARHEGIFCGVSSGGAAFGALALAKTLDDPDAVIAFIVCDRGDRYLSSGVFADN